MWFLDHFRPWTLPGKWSNRFHLGMRWGVKKLGKNFIIVYKKKKLKGACFLNGNQLKWKLIPLAKYTPILSNATRKEGTSFVHVANVEIEMI